MAIIGQGVQAGLGRVDYTPYLQGAMAGAQGIAQGISGIGRSAADAIQQYQKNKAANEVLEAENTRYLAYMESNPQMKAYAPDPKIIDKYRDKMLKGGLTLTDNRKLNAELNTAIKLSDRDREQERQQAYIDQVRESTKKMQFDLAQAEQDRKSLDRFNTALSQLSEGEGTPERIQEIGRSLGTPSAIVNTALSGRLDVGRYEISLAAQRASNIRNQVETELLNRQLEIARKANPNGTVEVIEKDGNQVIKMTDQSGKVDFKLVPRERPTKPPPEDALASLVQKYQIGQATNNPVLVNAAITEYADVMGFKGPGWSAETIGAELAGLAAKVPFRIPPPKGSAGITSAKPVSVEQKAPGTAAAPAGPAQPEVPVRTRGGEAVAQPNLPPQPETLYTPPEAMSLVQDQMNQAMQFAYSPDEVAQAIVQNAPPPPVVDTNLFVPTTPARAPQYGEDTGMRTAFGEVSPIARFMQRATEVNPEVVARRQQMAQMMGGVDNFAAAGPLSQGGGALGAMGRYLSGDNMAAETLRVMAAPFGAIPEQGNAPLPSQTTNLPSATLDVMASALESVPEARERMRREDANARLERRRAEQERNRPAPPMKSAELPQISLSKDAKRIADLLLQEYESNRGGKAPTFTITAARPGGKETSIKLSNPAILAIMSNPTNFGGIIRGNVEQFSQQNARMNQILAEMEAARAARSRSTRGR